MTELWSGAHGSVGRVVTWPAPDAYVLVDGVLLRALPARVDAIPGRLVRLAFDSGKGRLLMTEADPGDDPRTAGKPGAA
ncbi:hypothetical protein [Streptomyces sp. NBC_00996]|uniref:hypothetical protein n=1 Tax=Streptomyces sp. NBC_00996 TaxID=2903710 RepID=UPI0038634955|nr:hypothetical protein OG390_10670 [Streptomyces sp. NBC_00996]